MKSNAKENASPTRQAASVLPLLEWKCYGGARAMLYTNGLEVYRRGSVQRTEQTVTVRHRGPLAHRLALNVT